MVKKIEDVFIRFDRMYERDRHTHTQTQTQHDSIGRACIASRGKNWKSTNTAFACQCFSL